MTTDSPEQRSDTAIGSPAFEAAKEAAQARGWVMEPSVINAMLAAAVPFIRETIAAEIEAKMGIEFRAGSTPSAKDQRTAQIINDTVAGAARIASGVSGE